MEGFARVYTTEDFGDVVAFVEVANVNDFDFELAVAEGVEEVYLMTYLWYDDEGRCNRQHFFATSTDDSILEEMKESLLAMGPADINAVITGIEAIACEDQDEEEIKHVVH